MRKEHEGLGLGLLSWGRLWGLGLGAEVVGFGLVVGGFGLSTLGNQGCYQDGADGDLQRPTCSMVVTAKIWLTTRSNARLHTFRMTLVTAKSNNKSLRLQRTTKEISFCFHGTSTM